MQRFKLLPLAAATLVGLGLSSNAQANAYALAYDNIYNLTFISTPALAISDVTAFMATSTHPMRP